MTQYIKEARITFKLTDDTEKTFTVSEAIIRKIQEIEDIEAKKTVIGSIAYTMIRKTEV